MIPLLCWLVLPLVAAVALVPPGQRGGAVARLIVPVFALATLETAAGTLSLGALREWGMLGPSNALFCSISLGLILGGIGSWPPTAWRIWIAGIPLAGVLVAALWSVLRVGPVLLGAVLGAAPLLLAAIWPRTIPGGAPTRVRRPQAAWITLLLATVFALSPWLATVLLAPAIPLLSLHTLANDFRLPWRARVTPVVALAIALAVGWLALTIAGDAMVQLDGFSVAAPLSPGAERLLGLLGVGMVLLMVGPWPLHRLTPGIVLLPAAAIIAHRFAMDLAPGGLPAWRPLAAMIVVPATVVAANRGHWGNALGSAAVLIALQPGVSTAVAAGVATLAALAVVHGAGAADPTVSRRVTFPESRWVAVMLAAALALTPAAVLRDEVVLATLLAAGVAIAVARPERQMPSGMNSHLSSTLPPDGSDVTRTPPASL